MVKKRRVFLAMFLALAVMLQYSFVPQTFTSYAGETSETSTTEEASSTAEPASAPAPAAKAASTAGSNTSSAGSTTSSSTAASTSGSAAPAESSGSAAATGLAAPSADSAQPSGAAQAAPAESGAKDSTGGTDADGTADGNGDASGTGDEQSEISGSKTADPTELGEDRRTEVTLSLPSVEYQNEIDLVFVMDKSTSTTNNNIDFANQVESLINGILEMNSNLAINIGITKFRGQAEDAIAKVTDGKQSGLIRYSEAVKDIIESALKVTPDGNGSNIHSGLRMADKWLSDSSVDNNNKYVVMLTDGKSYIWNDEKDNPTSFYTQGYKHYAIATTNGIPQVGQVTGAQDKAAYPFDKSSVFWFDDYEDLYNSKNKELTSASKYDQLCRYAIDGSQPKGNAVGIATTNGAIVFKGKTGYQKYWEFTPSEEWKDLVWLEANPYEIIRNDDGSITFDTTKLNPDFYQSHPDALQKGLYKAGHLWTEMNDKYNCGSVIYNGWKSGSGLSIAKSFCSWLAENSDYSAKIKSKTESGSEVVQMFSDISNDIIYLIGSGQVEDKITSDFDLDDAIKSNAFKLKVGDDVIDLSSNEGDNWYFGAAVDGVYPYVVHYDSANKIITWDINVPVENARRAALTYGLILKEGSPEGYYDTNEYAKLNYTSSDGKKTGTFVFQKPKVHYTEKTDPDPTPAPAPTPTPDNPGTDPTPGGNGGGPAGGGIITAAAGGTGTAVITANPTPKAPATTINDPKPPLAASAYWALINLLCAIATALLSIIMIIRYFGRTKEEDEQVGDEVDVQRKGKLRIASIIPAIGAIIAFILTEDMSLPMEMVDKWTVMMVVILAIQVLVAIFANVRREEDDTEEATA